VNIRDTIAAVNQMQADGVIERYAIGDAVGATFYLEPVATLDADVFVTFRTEDQSLLISPKPIFDYLKARGGTMDGEYIVVAGWPVQFLPVGNPLIEEALAQAVEKSVAGISAWVFTAEHLAAIALQTGRGKDKARPLQFVENRHARSGAISIHHCPTRIATSLATLRATIPHAMTFDLAKILQSKREFRRRLAALPIEEKLALLDALRECALGIRPAPPVSKPEALHEEAPAYRTPGKQP
jgi:hypothetical protein